jgi:hypothetical protein
MRLPIGGGEQMAGARDQDRDATGSYVCAADTSYFGCSVSFTS